MIMRKKLNKKRLFYFVVILIALALFAITAVKVIGDITGGKEKTVKKELDIIEPYGYKLDDRDTATYKKYFKELKEVLNNKPIDSKKYAKLLTQLFITDFYTLDNKLASTDIGGIEFIHPDQRENFILNAQETMYKHVQSDLYNERKQSLPKVKEVSIKNIEDTTYKYKEKDNIAYKIEATWVYNKDLGYEKKGTFILLKGDDILYIVEKVDESEDDENE